MGHRGLLTCHICGWEHVQRGPICARYRRQQDRGTTKGDAYSDMKSPTDRLCKAARVCCLQGALQTADVMKLMRLTLGLTRLLAPAVLWLPPCFQHGCPPRRYAREQGPRFCPTIPVPQVLRRAPKLDLIFFSRLLVFVPSSWSESPPNHRTSQRRRRRH